MFNTIVTWIRRKFQKVIYRNFEKKIANGTLIITQQELKRSSTNHTYDPESTLEVQNPNYKIVGTQNKPTWIADLVVHRLYPGSSYAVLQNALIIGKHGTVIFDRKIVIDSILNSIGYLLHKSEKRLLRFNRWLPVKKEYSLGISLANCLSNSYFHWLGETLPMLEALDQFELSNSSTKPIIFLSENPPPFVFEYCTLMGISKDRIVALSSNKIKVRSLIVPTTRFFALKNNHDYWNRHIYPKTAFDYLRKKLLPSIQDTSLPQKIYLSRKDAELRKVSNESDLIPLLVTNGYEIISMTDLNISEQIAMFQNLTHLITPHGAGLANTIFSSKLRIIELYPKTRAFGYNYHYYQISSQYQHQHTLLLCECDENQNMTVESDQLVEILNDK